VCVCSCVCMGGYMCVSVSVQVFVFRGVRMSGCGRELWFGQGCVCIGV